MVQWIDTLIVGQGLAGSLLAWQLHQCAQRVHIVDPHHQFTASQVAAGLLNPVTGKRLVKSWQLEAFYPLAMEFYHQLETSFSTPFFINKTLYQVFQSQQQQLDWHSRCEEQSYRRWAGSYCDPGAGGNNLHDPFGSVKQEKAGFVRIKLLLSSLQKYFTENKMSSQARLDYQDLKLHHNGVEWLGYKARRVVFCEGYQLGQNPWFKACGMNPVKGDILTLQSREPLCDDIVNQSQWLVPIGNNLYRLGASYIRELDLKPSRQARRRLLQGLREMMVPLPAFALVDHQYGIRPASSDRRPIMGTHPRYPQLAVFNGFGSKGSLQIPYCAGLMQQHLNEASEIPESMNVSRFF